MIAVLVLRDEAVDQADRDARVGVDLSRQIRAYVEADGDGFSVGAVQEGSALRSKSAPSG